MLFAASAARADSGTYEMVFSFVTNYTRLEHPGQTVTIGPINGMQTIKSSSGGLFPEGLSNVTDCVVFAKKFDAGIDVQSYCTSVYPSGDKVFSTSTRKAGDLNQGGGGEGKSDLIGGTGQFAGIKGSCTYKTEYFPANHAVNHVKCRWQT
jgi:hypothetical protein